MKTKSIISATALAVGLVAGCGMFDKTDRTAQPQATGGKDVTASPTPERGQPSGSSVGDSNTGAFWTENARGGYMTKEQAMGYRGKDGKPMDFKKLDADGDGRVSQAEWTNYHGGSAGAAGPSGK
ncbi:MAG: hypothetical protein ACREV0_08195 [Burkholderiales bacterium]